MDRKHPALTPYAPLRPYGPFGLSSLRFVPEAQNGAEGGAGDASADASPPENRLSVEESKRIIAERDRAKTVNRRLVEDLGLEVEWEEADGGRKQPRIKGLDRLKQLRASADQADEDEKSKKGTWAERKAELDRQHQERMAATSAGHKRQVDGLTGLIGRLAVVEPLRAALAAEGAIDDADGKGEFGDLVTLLSPRLRTQIEVDEETGEHSVAVEVLDDAGKPLLDGRGNKVELRRFVGEWLGKRPHYRKSDFRRGSGSGGHGGAGGASAQRASQPDHAASAARELFGVR